MNTPIENGAIRHIDGVAHIFFDHYWIRYYEPPAETLSAKKKLLDALTRRTFHHTEPGINTPGDKLDEARGAWEKETDARRKRVAAAMLAGALFNRATDIFTTIVDLEERGIRITRDNELMRECANCFTEALELSVHVKHHSGEEGVDELWGEPVKVFTMPIADYYLSRYRKVAQAMRQIDQIGEVLQLTVCNLEWFAGAGELVDDFIRIAKKECEIFRSDSDYYQVWPQFVADGEKLLEFMAAIPDDSAPALERHIKRGTRILRAGKHLITWIANVRVPMPVSTRGFLDKCDKYRATTARIQSTAKAATTVTAASA
ncbi:MAG: hypothetical protein OXU62_12480 [Gammaproteobacteria bacterium]|nr:hypothetical protein [Gammaproteobacteria bacterium]MDD9885324.1 hypothetical protein [Gammaproteobacteria bacterium]